MKKDEVLDRFTKIIRDVMDNDNIVITEDTMSDDVEEWDSLTHVQLVDAIEHDFNIKFTSKEILLWDNIGDIIESIVKRAK